MQAPRNFRIVITGNTLTAASENFIRDGLKWYLPNLVMGRDVPEQELKLYGLTVDIEEDTDQGADA